MIVRHRYPTRIQLDDLDGTLDRAFEQLTRSFFDPRRSAPVLDAAWQDDQYVLTVDLPGVPAEAVSVEVTGDVLRVGAQLDGGHWQRTLRLGGRLDPEQVVARHVDGRLTVRIGMVAEPEPRRVEIDTAPVDTAPATAPAAPAIESSATEPADDQPADSVGE